MLIRKFLNIEGQDFILDHQTLDIVTKELVLDKLKQVLKVLGLHPLYLPCVGARVIVRDPNSLYNILELEEEC